MPDRPQPNEVQILHKWNTRLEAATYLRSSIPLFAALLGVVRKLPAPSVIHPSLVEKNRDDESRFPALPERHPLNAGGQFGLSRRRTGTRLDLLNSLRVIDKA